MPRALLPFDSIFSRLLCAFFLSFFLFWLFLHLSFHLVLLSVYCDWFGCEFGISTQTACSITRFAHNVFGWVSVSVLNDGWIDASNVKKWKKSENRGFWGAHINTITQTHTRTMAQNENEREREPFIVRKRACLSRTTFNIKYIWLLRCICAIHPTLSPHTYYINTQRMALSRYGLLADVLLFLVLVFIALARFDLDSIVDFSFLFYAFVWFIPSGPLRQLQTVLGRMERKAIFSVYLFDDC